mgnify:CR=1 FL=1
MAFAAGLKLRGALDTLAPWTLFRADARGRRGPDAKKKKYGQGTKEDAAAGQLARLPLDQRAQVRAGDLVVATRRGGGARRRRRARANRGVIGTTDRRAAVAQLLAVIGPRVAHVCAADRLVNAGKMQCIQI